MSRESSTDIFKFLQQTLPFKIVGKADGVVIIWRLTIHLGEAVKPLPLNFDRDLQQDRKQSKYDQ